MRVLFHFCNRHAFLLPLFIQPSERESRRIDAPNVFIRVFFYESVQVHHGLVLPCGLNDHGVLHHDLSHDVCLYLALTSLDFLLGRAIDPHTSTACWVGDVVFIHFISGKPCEWNVVPEQILPCVDCLLSFQTKLNHGLSRVVNDRVHKSSYALHLRSL